MFVDNRYTSICGHSARLRSLGPTTISVKTVVADQSAGGEPVRGRQYLFEVVMTLIVHPDLEIDVNELQNVVDASGVHMGRITGFVQPLGEGRFLITNTHCLFTTGRSPIPDVDSYLAYWQTVLKPLFPCVFYPQDLDTVDRRSFFKGSVQIQSVLEEPDPDDPASVSRYETTLASGYLPTVIGKIVYLGSQAAPAGDRMVATFIAEVKGPADAVRDAIIAAMRSETYRPVVIFRDRDLNHPGLASKVFRYAAELNDLLEEDRSNRREILRKLPKGKARTHLYFPALRKLAERQVKAYLNLERTILAHADEPILWDEMHGIKMTAGGRYLFRVELPYFVRPSMRNVMARMSAIIWDSLDSAAKVRMRQVGSIRRTVDQSKRA